MADTTGKVEYLKVGHDFGLVGLIWQTNSTTNREAFLIWFGEPDPPEAFARIRQSMMVSMLQEALENNLTVTITHDDNSALIGSLLLRH